MSAGRDCGSFPAPLRSSKSRPVHPKKDVQKGEGSYVAVLRASVARLRENTFEFPAACDVRRVEGQHRWKSARASSKAPSRALARVML